MRTTACPRTQHAMTHQRGTGLRKKSLHYGRTVSERVYEKQSPLWPRFSLWVQQRSHHGMVSPPQNQREGIREWKKEKEKATIRTDDEAGHYLGWLRKFVKGISELSSQDRERGVCWLPSPISQGWSQGHKYPHIFSSCMMRRGSSGHPKPQCQRIPGD